MAANVFTKLLLLFFIVYTANRAFADYENKNIALEKIAILITLQDEAITNKNAMCDALVKLLTTPDNAPWGLVAASTASCDINATELKVNPHELWNLKVIGNENEATWTINRPLNTASDKTKTEATQILSNNTQVRQAFYSNPKSLTILLASIVQQLAFFNANSVIIKNTFNKEIPLPLWRGSLKNISVCLSDNWDSFYIYHNNNTDKKTKCLAQNTWKTSATKLEVLTLIFTKEISELLKAEIINTQNKDTYIHPTIIKPLQFYINTQSGYGNTKLTTQHVKEANKNGLSKFVKVGVGLQYEKKAGINLGVNLGIDFGVNFSNISGHFNKLAITQKVEASFTFIDLSTHLYMWPGLLLGGVMRNTYAVDATYGFTDANKASYILAIGPSAWLCFNLNLWNFLGGAIYLSDINNPKRTVNTLYYSAGINYLFKN